MHTHLPNAIQHSFIDQTVSATDAFKARLLTNQDYSSQLLPSIIDQLKSSSSFDIAAAFVTKGGLSLIKTVLSDLAKKNIHGRLLTSNYLDFNDPEAYRELLKFPNLKVRISSKKGFHAKGYFFHHHNYSTAIIGSSNLTANALKENYEWNLVVSSDQNGDIYHKLSNTFEKEWNESLDLTPELIDVYASHRVPMVKNQYSTTKMHSHNPVVAKIVPNQMQEEALTSLQSLRDLHENKAIIISATGSGKTFLSAFDVQREAPKRFLFLAHREQILEKSIESYRKIMPESTDIRYGILSGNQKSKDANYLFAMVQTLSKDDQLNTFPADYFDYIVIDEVHRSGAESYQKILNYFTPKFLLGMTATPERTDGFNIFELFDYNVAYEIRLQDALEMEIIAPFHYFGVSDYEVNGEIIDDLTDLQYLTNNERVDYLIEKIHYYGYSGNKARGLIFCRSVEEAKALSTEFNLRGFKTTALSGKDSQAIRDIAVKQLEKGELEYIFVVDIFNEGIDIKSLNQVIMMRQTESSIIFLQQLGRGLRKFKDKEYLVVIDFIGNYQNNFLIPIALSGDQSLNKDAIRKSIIDPGFLTGISSINFEEIAKESILKSLASTSLDSVQNIRSAYLDLKNRIGRIPQLIDFITYNSIDPMIIIDKYASYDEFIAKMEKTPQKVFSPYLDKILQFLMKELSNGKRLQEVLLIEELLKTGKLPKTEYKSFLSNTNLLHDEETIHSVENLLNYAFLVSADRQKYGEISPIKIENNSYSFNEEVYQAIKNTDEYAKRIEDIIQVAKAKNKKYQSLDQLTLFERYSRKDVCRLLNWENDEKGTIYGYRMKHNTLPIFITYQKDAEINSDVHYADEILNADTIKWYSKSNQTLKSKGIREILEAQKNGTAKIYIFMKKNDSEGTDFYYLGNAKIDFSTVQDEKVLNHKSDKYYDIVSMNLVLKNSIELSLYHYLTS